MVGGVCQYTICSMVLHLDVVRRYGKTYAVTEVLDQILDLLTSALDLGIQPLGKGLLLDRDPALLFRESHPGEALFMGRLLGSEGVGGIGGRSLEPARLGIGTAVLVLGNS